MQLIIGGNCIVNESRWPICDLSKNAFREVFFCLSAAVKPLIPIPCRQFHHKEKDTRKKWKCRLVDFYLCLPPLNGITLILCFSAFQADIKSESQLKIVPVFLQLYVPNIILKSWLKCCLTTTICIIKVTKFNNYNIAL